MSKVSTWSTTAASNNSTPPDGAPEGWAPSKVNDTIREMMAQIRSYANDAQWFEYGDGDGSATITYASATSFTIPTDVTAAWHAGRRVKATGSLTGTIYGTIASSSYSAPDTTITMTWDSGSLSNESLTVWLGALSATNPAVPSSAAVRTAMGLGTAAVKNTGTSGNTVPLLDGANTHSGATIFTADVTFRSSDAGAGAGPNVFMQRNSASPATNDYLAHLRWDGQDSLGNYTEYAGLVGLVRDPTDGSEDGRLSVRTAAAGATGERAFFQSGLVMAGATGGDKGAGTINAAAYYENGVRMDAQGVAKAWVLFNGTDTVAITDSFNVTSITDNGTGDYTANFTTAFANANYTATGHVRKSGGGMNALCGPSTDTRTTSAYQFAVVNHTPAKVDAEQVNVTFHGDQ